MLDPDPLACTGKMCLYHKGGRGQTSPSPEVLLLAAWFLLDAVVAICGGQAAQDWGVIDQPTRNANLLQQIQLHHSVIEPRRVGRKRLLLTWVE